MDPAKRILQGADELFKKVGVRNVTMDDIASHLGMSKKTIYQHFSNKKEIVHAGMHAHFHLEKEKYAEIHGQAEDAIHEMILLMLWVAESFKMISPVMIYDIKKYYSGSWKLFEEFKNDFVLKIIRENLEKGVSQGLYRKELDLDIMMKLRLEEIELFLKPGLFPEGKFTLAYLQTQILDHYLHGLVTLQGKKLINKYLNKPEDE